MLNLISGIFVVLISFIGYYYSYKNFKENKIALSIALLVLFGLILRIYLASDFFLHEWDERYHALVAKNLMDFPLKPMLYKNPVLPYDIENWPGNHVWLHKQPFPLWSMALSMFLFGVNEIAIRIPSILLTSIGIFLSYEIGRELFNRRVGYIAAFLYSINGVIIEVSAGRIATDHVDAFFLFFVELAVYLAIKYANSKKVYLNIACGISIGLAILCKWLPALIVLPIWIFLVMRSKRFSFKEALLNFMLMLITLTMVFLPWQLYIHNTFPEEAAWESLYNLKHYTEVLEKQSGSFFYHFNDVRILYGELIYLPMIWLVWKVFKKPKSYSRLILFIWIFIPFIFFAFAATKMQGYILFTSPALFILTGIFWEYLYVNRNKFRRKWLIKIILVLLLALPIRYTIERLKAFELRDKNPQWVKELKELNVDENSVLFNCERPIEAMFYTECTAYRIVPNIRKVKDLIEEGYAVHILDDGSLNKSYARIEGVTIVPSKYNIRLK